jgi:hypothetical protein
MGKRMLLRRERSLLIHRSCGHERGASQNESQQNAGWAGSFHRGNFIMIAAQQQRLHPLLEDEGSRIKAALCN